MNVDPALSDAASAEKLPLGQDESIILFDPTLQVILGFSADLDLPKTAARLSDTFEIELIHQLRNALGILRYGNRPEALYVGTATILGATRSMMLERSQALCVLRLTPPHEPFSRMSDPTLILRVLMHSRDNLCDDAQARLLTICHNLRRVVDVARVSMIDLRDGQAQVRARSGTSDAEWTEAHFRHIGAALSANTTSSPLKMRAADAHGDEPITLTAASVDFRPEIGRFAKFERTWLPEDGPQTKPAHGCMALPICDDPIRCDGNPSRYFFFETFGSFRLSHEMATSLMLFARIMPQS